MQKVFKGMLPPDAEQVDRDFEKAVIVLDTNVLLDLYRYSRTTAGEYLALIESTKHQLWMPYQVGFEFLKNRNTVRASAYKEHANRIEKLSSLEQEIANSQSRTHVGQDASEQKFNKALRKYKKHLARELDELRSWGHHFTPDDTLRRLIAAYEGSVGPEPDADWVKTRSKEGDERFKELIPPGYEDAKKPTNKHGDYFFWVQCLEHCTEQKLPLVLVTGDNKPDWWDQNSSKKSMGPRIELAREFNKATDETLYMYSPLSFFNKVAAIRDAESAALTAARKEVARVQNERRRLATQRISSVATASAIAAFAENAQIQRSLSKFAENYQANIDGMAQRLARMAEVATPSLDAYQQNAARMQEIISRAAELQNLNYANEDTEPDDTTDTSELND